MTIGKANQRIVASRLEWVERMVADIRLLPLGSYEEFTSDRRNVGSAESCLRRALEALLDLGRHVLGKVFGKVVPEYKQIADELGAAEVITLELSRKLRVLAGYRNRMVHFYHDIDDRELYTICSQEIADVLEIRDAMREWLSKHPELIDTSL
jgi:uncharacterized protein YutE (UPF0331/DUF86 family)